MGPFVDGYMYRWNNRLMIWLATKMKWMYG